MTQHSAYVKARAHNHSISTTERPHSSGCRAGSLIVFLMFCDCKCSVALSDGAEDWSAECDCVFPGHTHFLFLDLKTGYFLCLSV